MQLTARVIRHVRGERAGARWAAERVGGIVDEESARVRDPSNGIQIVVSMDRGVCPLPQKHVGDGQRLVREVVVLIVLIGPYRFGAA